MFLYLHSNDFLCVGHPLLYGSLLLLIDSWSNSADNFKKMDTQKNLFLTKIIFVYELSGCGFESSCNRLNFRFRAWFKQGVSWHSGNYRVTWQENTLKVIFPWKTYFMLIEWREGRGKVIIFHCLNFTLCFGGRIIRNSVLGGLFSLLNK